MLNERHERVNIFTYEQTRAAKKSDSRVGQGLHPLDVSFVQENAFSVEAGHSNHAKCSTGKKGVQPT
jgi:hypothetical protein